MGNVYEPLIIPEHGIILHVHVLRLDFFFLKKKKKKKKKKIDLLGDQDLEISLMKDILDFGGDYFSRMWPKMISAKNDSIK